MMKRFLVSMVVAGMMIGVVACGKTASAEVETISTTDSAEVETISTTDSAEVETTETKWSQMSWDEIYDSFEEVTPSLNVSLDRYMTKCVATLEYEFWVDYESHETTTTKWDVYLYVNDGLVGTIIVNEAGELLDFYGCVFDHVNDNYNVCIADGSLNMATYVYPCGERLENYMMVLDTLN